MNNLDFYLNENGRVQYSRDLSLTQYSTQYVVRLLTKKAYDIVNMNVTLPNQIKTYKKNLQLESMKVDGYFAYTYILGQDVTGCELGADKATIKIGFFLYPDASDQSKIETSGLCYLTLLSSPEDMPSDGSVTVSELANLQNRLNDIQNQILDLNIGEIDTAKNYNTTKGTIKEKFDSVEASIGSLDNRTDLIEKQIGTMVGDTSIIDQFTEVNQKIDSLEDSDVILLNKIEGIENVLPTLKAGIKYEVVDSLPTNPKDGVIYLVKDPNELNNNFYKEYMYINNKWEIIGDTLSEIELNKYLTLDEATNTYVAKNDLGKLVSDKGFIKNTADAFSYENLKNKPTIPTRTSDLTNDSGYTTLSAVNTQLTNYVSNSTFNSTKQSLENSINSLNTDVGDLRTDLSSTNETAVEALTLARNASTSAKVFDTKNDLITFIQTKPEKALPLGAVLLVKDILVPDYWVSAVYESPTQYTTKNNEVLNNVYYGIEAVETGIDISEYAKLTEVDTKISDHYNTTVSPELAKKENTSNKITEIKSTSTNVEYPSGKAVYDLVNSTKTTIENDVGNTYATKESLTNAVSTINGTIQENRNELNAKDTAIEGRLDGHDTTIGEIDGKVTDHETRITQLRKDLDVVTKDAPEAFNTLKEIADWISDPNSEGASGAELLTANIEKNKAAIEKEVTDRASADTVIEGTITALKNEYEAYKTDAENKYLQYNDTISKAESIVDYRDTTKNLKLSTDSTETEFVISNQDMTELQTLLASIVPNEYN